MKNIGFILIMVFGSTLCAQETNVSTSDQNPNAQAAYKKYAKVADDYTIKQGTTAQETYVAIDPMEEKRIRQKIRKDHRAMRGLWRHEERMERAKHSPYIYSRPYYGYTYNPVFRNSFYGGFGLGYVLGNIRF